MSNAPNKIINLGDVGWTNLNDAFKNNPYLEAATIGAGINQLTEMINTFYNCKNLTEINVVDWDICNITSLHNFLKNTKLSTDSYSAMLVHFADNSVIQVGVPFHGGDSFYNEAGEVAKNTLVNVYQWEIEDNGLQPEWIQVLTTDTSGNLVDLVITTVVPSFRNTGCLKFTEDNNYIEIEDKLIEMHQDGIFDFKFDYHAGDSSTCYLFNSGYYTSNGDGIGLYTINNDWTLYRRSGGISVISMVNCVNTWNTQYAIHMWSDGTTIWVESTNASTGTVLLREYVNSWSHVDTVPDHNFRIGRNGDSGVSYIKLGNIRIDGIAHLPLEEPVGYDIYNAIPNAPATLNITENLINVKSTFDRTDSFCRQYGYNKPNDYTHYPSFAKKTIAAFKIDDDQTYAKTDADFAYSFSTPSYESLIKVAVRVNATQDKTDSVLFSLGDRNTDTTDSWTSIRYNGTGLYCEFIKYTLPSVVTTTAININANALYYVEIIVNAAGSYCYMGLRVYDDEHNVIGTQTERVNVYASSFSRTYDSLYFGQPYTIGFVQDGCHCQFSYVEVVNTSDGVGNLLYENQLLGDTYTITDTLQSNDAVIFPKIDIADSWGREINEQDGIYVDCVKYKELRYPACKDGILHNGAIVDFAFEDKNFLTSIVGDDDGVVLTYKYHSTDNDRPIYKSTTTASGVYYYIYYDPSRLEWKKYSTFSYGYISNIPYKSGAGFYPPSGTWTNGFTLTYENWYPSVIEENGYATELSYSDMILFTRDNDNIIPEKHITDSGVTVLDKLQIIKPT